MSFVFYVFFQDRFNLQFFIFFSGIPFLLFVKRSFGLFRPIIKPAGDEVYINHKPYKPVFSQNDLSYRLQE